VVVDDVDVAGADVVGAVVAGGSVVVVVVSFGLASAVEPGTTAIATVAEAITNANVAGATNANVAGATMRSTLERDTMLTTSRRTARYDAIRRISIGRHGPNLERVGDIVRAPWTPPVM
jgi:hypothetical protein